MAGSEYLTIPFRIALVVVPVAVYFLVLGLLNSRRHPQLLRGRGDFALLLVALSPLFVLPALSYLGVSTVTVLLAVTAVAGCIWLLSPRGQTWVIYNMPLGEACEVVARTLSGMGLEVRRRQGGFELPGCGAGVELGGFSLLRNVSVRLCGPGAPTLARQFEQQLSQTLSSIRTEASPMAVSLLLVAVAMLVAPLTLMAHRAAEIVRLLTDLLQ